MRKFQLKTGTGKIIDLTSKEIFFHEPTGLGFDEETTFKRIGSRYSLIDRHIGQGAISGKLAFTGVDPYAQYNQFVQDTYDDGTTWGLRLLYSVDDTTTYMRNVVISSLQKTEINLCGYLECDITFLASTPWYRQIRLYTPSDSPNAGWVWTPTEANPGGAVTWGNEEGGVIFRSSVSMSLTINVDTNMISPCLLMIEGPISNPEWKHYLNGSSTPISTGAVNCEVPADMTLYVENRIEPYSIKIRRNSDDSLYEDVYSQSNFATDRFIKLRKGANTIVVTSQTTPSTVNVNTSLEAHLYYAGV